MNEKAIIYSSEEGEWAAGPFTLGPWSRGIRVRVRVDRISTPNSDVMT